jgi:hypothetical protein
MYPKIVITALFSFFIFNINSLKISVLRFLRNGGKRLCFTKSIHPVIPIAMAMDMEILKG